MKKTLLISLAVLLGCQLGLAQIQKAGPALAQFSKAAATGRPQPVMPMAAPGTHARSVVWFSGKSYSALKPLVAPGVKPALPAPGEPSFCDLNSGTQQAICPKGVQTAYGTNFIGANGGAGMTVAIVDYFYYTDAENAFGIYNAAMGLPACTTANGCFSAVDMSNGNQCFHDADCYGWEVETMLDIEAVHAMAPKAKIVYIGGDPYGYGTNEELYAQLVGDATSNSWTFNAGESVATVFESSLAQGPPTLFASGDAGSFPPVVISYPCTSPNATCIGGTSLYLNTNLTRMAEYGWSGSGGGCSAMFAIPSYQGANGSNVCVRDRAAPDVSAIADPATPFAVYIGGDYAGHFYGVGGTSLATPILAGLIADMDAARVSFGKAKLTYSSFNNGVYSAASHNYPYFFYDVTVGNNGYAAGTQYDLVTGLGVPVGKDLGNRFFGLP